MSDAGTGGRPWPTITYSHADFEAFGASACNRRDHDHAVPKGEARGHARLDLQCVLLRSVRASCVLLRAAGGCDLSADVREAGR